MKTFCIIAFSAVLILLILQYLLKKVWPMKTFSYEAERILLEKDPELHSLMKEIGEELKVPLEAVIYTHYALVKGQAAEGVNGPDRTSEIFLELFNEMYANSPQKGIMALRINSSKDLGKIVFGLARKQIISIPTSLTEESFSDQFEQVG
jgi:hypothetical protein